MTLTSNRTVLHLHIWIKQIDQGLSMPITTFITLIISRGLFELAIVLKFYERANTMGLLIDVKFALRAKQSMCVRYTIENISEWQYVHWKSLVKVIDKYHYLDISVQYLVIVKYDDDCQYCPLN